MSKNNKPHWTAEDVADAKAVRRLFVNAKVVCRGGLYGKDLYVEGIAYIHPTCFPSLGEGESATLDEILEADT